MSGVFPKLGPAIWTKAAECGILVAKITDSESSMARIWLTELGIPRARQLGIALGWAGLKWISIQSAGSR